MADAGEEWGEEGEWAEGGDEGAWEAGDEGEWAEGKGEGEWAEGDADDDPEWDDFVDQ